MLFSFHIILRVVRTSQFCVILIFAAMSTGILKNFELVKLHEKWAVEKLPLFGNGIGYLHNMHALTLDYSSICMDIFDEIVTVNVKWFSYNSIFNQYVYDL